MTTGPLLVTVCPPLSLPLAPEVLKGLGPTCHPCGPGAWHRSSPSNALGDGQDEGTTERGHEIRVELKYESEGQHSTLSTSTNDLVPEGKGAN